MQAGTRGGAPCLCMSLARAREENDAMERRDGVYMARPRPRQAQGAAADDDDDDDADDG